MRHARMDVPCRSNVACAAPIVASCTLSLVVAGSLSELETGVRLHLWGLLMYAANFLLLAPLLLRIRLPGTNCIGPRPLTLCITPAVAARRAPAFTSDPRPCLHRCAAAIPRKC